MTDSERKVARMKDRVRETKKIENKRERYDALVEFIRPEHTDKSRWSIDAIADVANEYIQAENERDSLANKTFSDGQLYRWVSAEMSVLQRLLMENGWGCIVGLW